MVGLYDQTSVQVEQATIFREYNRSSTVAQIPIDVSEGDTVGRDACTLASPASESAAGRTVFELLFLVNINRVLLYL
jgi:hypothetical protein